MGIPLHRIEPAVRERLDQLPHWDNSSVDALRASQRSVEGPPAPTDPRVTREDVVLRGWDGRPDVRVRWYRPVAGQGNLPCLIYLHGGGYVLGSIEANDDRLDLMAATLGCAIASVDWRLAPEHPYPAGLDDAESVWRHLSGPDQDSGIDRSRIVVGGASAGAGLAAGLCLRLRDLGEVQPILQLLIYPMIDNRHEHFSMREYCTDDPGHPGLWHAAAQRLCWSSYLKNVSAENIPATAVPARAESLAGLAPAFIGVGDVDPYRDEDVEYARRLAEAGVPVELHVYPGVIHGGLIARPYTPRTKQFLGDVHKALIAAFGLD